MLNKFVEAENMLEAAKKANAASDKMNLRNSEIETPGDAVNATDAALDDLKEILIYFKENFLDANGKLIKISFWKWVFVKQYRDKIAGAIDYVIEKVKLIASRFM